MYVAKSVSMETWPFEMNSLPRCIFSPNGSNKLKGATFRIKLSAFWPKVFGVIDNRIKKNSRDNLFLIMSDINGVII
jgi:hypothetical protein